MQSIPNPSLSLLGKKIAFSTFVQYAGKIFQLVLSTIALRLISSFLSDNGYSYYAAITEFALFFSVMANLGIFGNLVRLMSDDPKDGKVFTQALLLRLTTAFIFFLIAIPVLLSMQADQIFFFGTILFLSALFFDYITSVCDAMLQANYLMGRATAALVAGRIINVGLLYLAINSFNPDTPLTQSLFLILACSLSGSLFTAILSFIMVRQKIKLQWHWNWELIIKIFQLSIPFGLINIFNSLYFRFLPDYFAHNVLNDLQFSSFNISFRISQVLSLASTFLMFSVLPGLKQYIDQKNWTKAEVLTKRISYIMIGAGLILFTFGSLLGPFAIEFLTHKKYFLDEFAFLLPSMLLLTAISYGYDLVLLTLFAFNDEIWFLKREVIALCLALLIFTFSLLIQDSILQVFFIVLGAIVAESFMVINGYLRLKYRLKTHRLAAEIKL
ncbi:MAG: oligosaccharide flippase family protein [Candidatus Altimarinota bacterium]